MFVASGLPVDTGLVGKMIGGVVRSWGHRLTGEYGMSDEDAARCVIEGERIGKAFAELFHREEGG